MEEGQLSREESLKLVTTMVSQAEAMIIPGFALRAKFMKNLHV